MIIDHKVVKKGWDALVICSMGDDFYDWLVLIMPICQYANMLMIILYDHQKGWDALAIGSWVMTMMTSITLYIIIIVDVRTILRINRNHAIKSI